MSVAPIVVLGTGGFVGQAVMRQVKTQSLPVVGYTRQDADILDGEALRQVVRGAEVVINCAARAGVDQAETQGEAAYAVNRDGPRQLAEIAHKAGAALIHISTDFVFDGEKADAYVESDAINPLSVYGLSKAAGEGAVAKACPRSLIVRTAWVYDAAGRGFVANLLQWARERDVIQIVADQSGSPTHVAELASGLLKMAQQARQLPRMFDWGIYHLTGSGTAKRIELAQAVLAVARDHGVKVPRIEPTTLAAFPGAARRPVNSALDNSKALKAFGITMTPWREKVAATLTQHFRDNGAR